MDFVDGLEDRFDILTIVMQWNELDEKMNTEKKWHLWAYINIVNAQHA